jgi:hypothetical protein
MSMSGNPGKRERQARKCHGRALWLKGTGVAPLKVGHEHFRRLLKASICGQCRKVNLQKVSRRATATPAG